MARAEHSGATPRCAATRCAATWQRMASSAPLATRYHGNLPTLPRAPRCSEPDRPPSVPVRFSLMVRARLHVRRRRRVVLRTRARRHELRAHVVAHLQRAPTRARTHAHAHSIRTQARAHARNTARARRNGRILQRCSHTHVHPSGARAYQLLLGFHTRDVRFESLQPQTNTTLSSRLVSSLSRLVALFLPACWRTRTRCA
jgi:hypothetical protein